MNLKEKLTNNLAGNIENHIFPFLWMRGEPEETIREYMKAIYASGIRAVFIESRPHPDFVGPGWWHDMDIILDEAHKNGMRIWILDDSHFPTGYANGAMSGEPESRHRKSIVYESCEVTKQADYNIAAFLKKKEHKTLLASLMAPKEKKKKCSADKMISVTAISTGSGERIDLTSGIRNGHIHWTAPGPGWRLCMVKESFRYGAHPAYINMLQEDSCRVLINTVYEPHWTRYKEHFGTTIAGFFSDEPELGNGPAYAHEKLGTAQDLPWSDALIPLLEETMGKDWGNKLLFLWENDLDPDETAKIRFQYMDAVTRAVKRSFSDQIGRWCREHGVEYIGHIVEDLNGHSRTGGALGHYFRGLWGQDMAGIDDIGGQVYPQGEEEPKKFMNMMDRDGEFYHYMLGRLAPSLAALDVKKKGRSMCEIFGNYGWTEGLRLERFLADHFLVNNINYFVPHAFSMRKFPDPDCPPHFYAHGHNPQYRHFRYLMDYINRVAALTSGGKEVVPVALLYNAESEWTNESMLDQTVLHRLTDRQINAELVPADAFTDVDDYHTDLTDGLCVNGQSYKCFVIPETSYIGTDLAKAVHQLSMQGYPVLFVNRLPEKVYDSDLDIRDWLKKCMVVPLEELAEVVLKNGWGEISISSPCRRLHYLHYRNQQDMYCFINEEKAPYQGIVTIPKAVKLYAYNAWDNRLETVKYQIDEERDITDIDINLEPLQSLILICDDDPAGVLRLPLKEEVSGLKRVGGDIVWRRRLCRSIDYPKFGRAKKVRLPDGLAKEKPHFSGWVRYEAILELKKAERTILELTDAYEGVEVTVNGKHMGVQVTPVYRFDISDAVKEGKNAVRIDVSTTLERERAAALNKGMVEIVMNIGVKMHHPTGINGEVFIYQS